MPSTRWHASLQELSLLPEFWDTHAFCLGPGSPFNLLRVWLNAGDRLLVTCWSDEQGYEMRNHYDHITNYSSRYAKSIKEFLRFVLERREDVGKNDQLYFEHCMGREE